jgi:hypothetical protein
MSLITKEDSGQAQILEVADEAFEDGIWYRIISWDETCQHADMKRLIGKKIRVTLEILEEGETS